MEKGKYTYIVAETHDELINKYSTLLWSVLDKKELDETTVNAIAGVAGVTRDYCEDLLIKVLEKFENLHND